MYTLIFLLYSLTFAVNTDASAQIDPLGKQVTVYSDEGPGLCPVGRRSASTNTDKGLGVDPNG